MGRVTERALLVGWGLAFGALPALAGCPGRGSELEREVAREQKAIRAYADRVPVIAKLSDAFFDAWKQTNEIKDVAAFREALRERVMPALAAYRKALEEMPVEGSKELAEIHQELVGAWARSTPAFEAYVTGLTPENLAKRHETLLATTESIAQTMDHYQERLRVYYEKNRVALVPAAKDDGDVAP